jgi:predicted enzyme related to lactoylglutathione lyase
MSGRVVHFEIPADDLQRAQSFYQDAFGWECQPMAEANYTLVTTGPSGDLGPTESGYINGGLSTRDPQRDRPLVVVDVDDIDTALEKVLSLGGSKVADKIDVMGMGWAAYFTDSEGNVIGLWQTAASA